MRTYLAGPMSGLPDHNYPAFKAAAKRLRGQGVQVISPHEITPSGYGPWSWQEHMRVDLAALLTCEVIVMLPGWQQSRGAQLEKTVAEAIGLSVVYYTLTETL